MHRSLLPRRRTRRANGSKPAISFQLSAVSFVTLKVTDVLGREVATLVNGVVAPGAHTVIWDGKSDNREQQPSGVYFYTLKTADKSTTKRMILMK
jgi:flagellar hook assembly protein FlgD